MGIVALRFLQASRTVAAAVLKSAAQGWGALLQELCASIGAGTASRTLSARTYELWTSPEQTARRTQSKAQHKHSKSRETRKLTIRHNTEYSVIGRHNEANI